MNRSTRLLGAALAVATTTAVTAQALASPEIRPGGRLHLDAAFHDEDNVQLDDNILARRTRLGATGELDEYWSFKLEYDFSENSVSAQDLFLQRGLGTGALRIGHFKVPMGLNELTSSNAITFGERASSNNIIAPGRRLGIDYQRFRPHYGYQFMVYGRALAEDLANGDMQRGLGGRLVFNPVHDEARMVHLGLSVAAENRGDQNAVRFRDRPEARPAGVRLIDTGAVDADDETGIWDASSVLRYGVEAAWQAGPFSLEAEYLRAEVDRDDRDDPAFGGWHVQASHVLTGESRGYGNGRFGGITPRSPGGAWELAARYSSADLEGEDIVGGRQRNITLGLNWYTSARVRFMANYILVDVEDSTAVVAQDEDDDDILVGDDSPRILLLRAQYSF